MNLFSQCKLANTYKNSRITQGAFSYLPDLSDDQIKGQVQYAISQKWSVAIEYTDYPHPRNSYWEMWGLPLFDLDDAAVVMYEIEAARKANPKAYIRVVCYSNARGVESCVLSFIINRPDTEYTFYLNRAESKGRQLVYTLT